jgi:hypothetical protein
MFPLSTNMHTEMVAGSGLCLFYNSLVLLFVVALAVAITVSVIWSVTTFPDMGYGGECKLHSDKAFQDAVDKLNNYQRVSAIGYGWLWGFLFFFSLYWAGFQHLAYREIDRKTALMSDFALRVTGLPRDASESEIAAFFEQLAPGGGVVGVSIAYDFRGYTDLVEELLERHVHMEDRRFVMRHRGEVPLNQFPGAQEAHEEDRAKAVLTRLECSGVAFVVCKSERERERLYNLWNIKRWRFRHEDPIKLHVVYEEPCCFFWENFAYGRRSHFVRGFLQVVILFIEMAVLALIVYWPAAYYIFDRIMAMGNDSTDPVIMLLGYGIALMNVVMYKLVDMSSRRIGFYYKVDVDMFNLIGCTIIVGVQTFFNLAVAYFAVKSVDVSMARSLFPSFRKTHELDDLQVARDASLNFFVSAHLWNLLVPGVLVLPDLLGRFFKYVLSATALYDYWVYIPFIFKQDLRTDPDVTIWKAERQLLPAPMQTEFDYANGICITSTAFLVLFFQSQYAHLTCWVLVGWVMLSYITLKVCHLRFNMVVDYTSYSLDDCFMYLWGIPLSILAAASAYWAVIPFQLPWWSSYAAFPAAYLLYLLLLHVILRSVSPFDNTSSASYYKARNLLGYDYFNTNPIIVLKSRYLRKGRPLTFFVRGKEYLQTVDNTNYITGTVSGTIEKGIAGISEKARLFAYEQDSDNEGVGYTSSNRFRSCTK